MKNRNDSNIKLNIISIVIMAVIIAIIMSFYPIIKENGNKAIKDKYFTCEIGSIINSADFYFLKDITDYDSGKNNSLEDVYIKSYELNDDAYYENAEESEYLPDYNNVNEEKIKKIIGNNLEQRYNDANTDVKYNYKNIQYAVLSKDNKVIKTNSNNDILNLNKVKDNYDCYIKMTFDENGYISIVNSYGIDEQRLYSEINNNSTWYIEGYGENSKLKIEINKIKNSTIIYALPKTLKYNDEFSRIKTDFETSVSTGMVAAFVVSVCIIFLLGSLLVPYKIGIKIMYSRIVKKIPLEIAIIIYGILAYITLVIGTYGVQGTLDGSLIRILNDLNMGGMYSNIISNVLNIGLWITTIYSIFTGVMLLKYILITGLFKYYKDNTILYKTFNFVRKMVLKLKNDIYHMDLKDKSNKMILKIVVINFFIVSFISIICFFGIIAALVYSVALFIILMKYMNNIKEKFSKLINVTNQISNGNLDIEMNEDLGIFNPILQSVMNIKSGFKNAVDEEVKSQKMKTELISNVSHDLKTPLTSIITYVDLLKKPEITEEERKEYIETLDKKSQRLKVLIEDLFEVSKATSGNIKLNLGDVDIVQLMKQTIVEFEDKLKSSGLELKCDYPSEKVTLSLDGAKTYRIFENLLNNVCKYAMENSRVYVQIINNDNEAVVVIKNISANEIDFKPDEIVERFQRGDKSRNTEGSGLGLAIVKSFTEAQNGTFNLELDGDLFKVTIRLNKNN